MGDIVGVVVGNSGVGELVAVWLGAGSVYTVVEVGSVLTVGAIVTDGTGVSGVGVVSGVPGAHATTNNRIKHVARFWRFICTLRVSGPRKPRKEAKITKGAAQWQCVARGGFSRFSRFFRVIRVPVILRPQYV